MAAAIDIVREFADADWSDATVWFSDERCVPPDHEDSNFGMASRALLSRLTHAPRVMRMEGELGHEAGMPEEHDEIGPCRMMGQCLLGGRAEP